LGEAGQIEDELAPDVENIAGAESRVFPQVLG
jgi:hypothetical protein